MIVVVLAVVQEINKVLKKKNIKKKKDGKMADLLNKRVGTKMMLSSEYR